MSACKAESFSSALPDEEELQYVTDLLSSCENKRKILYLSVHNTDSFLHHSHVLDLLWDLVSPLPHQNGHHHQPHVVHAERTQDHNIYVIKGGTSIIYVIKFMLRALTPTLLITNTTHLSAHSMFGHQII